MTVATTEPITAVTRPVVLTIGSGAAELGGHGTSAPGSGAASSSKA